MVDDVTGPSRRTLLISGLASGWALTAPLSGCSAAGSSASTSSTSSSGPTEATGPSGTAAPVESATPGKTPGGPSPAVQGTAPLRPAGADILHGPRTGTGVALTFHGAGDAAILRRMLDLLAARGAKVTVLAIGQWLAAQPAAARQVLAGGHDLGNHTWSHQTMPRLPAGRIGPEIDRAAAQLRALTGSPGRWFRPSGTPASTPAIRAAAVRAGYGACLGYDVDPLDYTDPGAAAIVRNLAAKVRPGSIVSLHLGHQETLDAMPRILDTLEAKGLRAVTATTLLGGS